METSPANHNLPAAANRRNYKGDTHLIEDITWEAAAGTMRVGDPDPIACPKGLPPAVAAAYRRIARSAAGILSAGDTDLVILAAESLAAARKYDRQAAAIAARKTPPEHPTLAQIHRMAQDHRREYRSILAALAVTPQERQKTAAKVMRMGTTRRRITERQAPSPEMAAITDGADI